MTDQRHLAAEELGRRHPTAFTVLSLPTYKPEPFHWVIGDYLRQVADGTCRRLIVNVPPRHGKSELVSTRFPVWYLGGAPSRSVILASYAAGLSTGFGRKSRNLIQSSIFQRAFPGISIERGIGAAGDNWALSNGGRFVSAGVGGSITGHGANVFIIDDPYKNFEQAQSPRYRESIKDWYREVVLSRMAPGGAVVIVMTRWSYDDLCGWLLREWGEEGWKCLRFPAIQDVAPTADDPRLEGAPLWHELGVYEQRREEVGPASFNGLYQQTPGAGAATVLQTAWLQQDFDAESPPRFVRVISSWDTAFEETTSADYTVGTVWGDAGGDFYLLDVIRGRWTFPDLKARMIAAQSRWGCSAVLVEKAASGRDILHELRRTTDLPVIAVKVESSKLARAHAVSGRLEAGRVHVPRHAAWLSEFYQELDRFPAGEYDDQVDSLTQAVRWLTRHSGQEAVAA